MSRHLANMTLWLAALLGSILLVFFALVLPSFRDVATLREQLIAEQRELEGRYQKGLLLKRLREDWETVKKELPGLEQAVLTHSASIPFITRLEALAEEHDVTHRLSLPLPDRNATQRDTSVAFEMQWQGTWEHLLRMLVALEREPYYLTIEHIRITSEPTLSSPPPLSLTAPQRPATNTLSEKRITMILTGNSLWRNE